MLTTGDTRERLVRRDLAWAGVALVVAVGAGLATTYAIGAGAIPDPRMQVIAAYLATWIPLVVAVWAVCARAGWSASLARLGARFGVLDIFWGVAGGCVARLIDAVSRLQLTGTTGLAPQPVIGTPVIDGWTVVLGIIAPVVIAPVIEEMFFRGLLQRSLTAAMDGRGPGRGAARGPGRFGAAALAILVTSALFTVAHLAVGGATGVAAVAVGVGTFAFSVIAGVIAAGTGRLGGAIIAHVVFNGVAVLLLWPR